MSQPYPSVLAGRYSALEGGWQSNANNGLPIPSPTAYGNLAAWYDVSDPTSMVIDGSNRVSLIGDKSGNSATNCLATNGVSGGEATTPSAAANRFTGDITIVVRMTSTLSGTQIVVSKDDGSTARCYQLYINEATPRLLWTTNGSTSSFDRAATTTLSYSVGQIFWIKVELDVDNGASGNTVRFYTANDTGNNTEPSSWSQLGSDVTNAGTTSVFDSASQVLAVGSRATLGGNTLNGCIFYASVRGNIGGAISQYFDPSASAKFASSVVSGGTTWTINSSGDLGARICGQRDLVQLTASKQPLYTAASGSTPAYLTFDGTDDYMRTAQFMQPQPVTRYTVARQISWTSGRYLWDGAAGANSGATIQTTASPQVNLNAGSSAAGNTDWAVGTDAVITSVLNGASSSIRVNRGTATTGNAGSTSQSGITIGASGAVIVANFGNLRFNECISYTVAQDSTVQNRVVQSLGSKWRVVV